jgi:mannose-6-phosphate isomerase
LQPVKKLYPLLLEPSLHTKVWGGRRLETLFNKSLPTDEPYGEAWELHDTSTVTNGTYARLTLGELLEQTGTDLIGDHNDPADGFPLLGKFIDAADWLSIQVHPNDEQAAELEGQPRGKTEAWIFLATEPGAKLVLGVKPGTTREIMAQAIRDGVLEEHIGYGEVKDGDVLLLNANTVHALGPGILIYEIQQSSNTTYRLYDWNRMGLDGNPRELHIEKGVQVSNIDFLPPIAHPWGTDADPVVTLVESPYFKTDLYRVRGDVALQTGGRFHGLTCVSGSVAITDGSETITTGKGRSALIPASLPAYTLSGEGNILVSYQP